VSSDTPVHQYVLPQHQSDPSQSPIKRVTSTISGAPQFSVPTSYDEPPTSTNRYEKLLDQIEDLRWELRDARENLHGERAKLRSQRQALQVTRDQTAVKAAKAFDLLKRYLLERNVDPPQDIQYALEDVDFMRDRLGQHEVDYEQAENRYNMDEWTYTEIEKRFVDDLYAHGSSDPVHVDNKAFTQFAVGASGDPEAHVWEELGSSWPSTESDLDLGELQNAVVHSSAAFESSILPSSFSRPIHDTSLGETTSVALHHRPAREDLLISRRPPRPIPAGVFSASITAPGITRPYSEGDLDQARLHWPETRKRIEEWLLDALKGSQFQKAHLRNWVSSDGSEFSRWWTTVEQHWTSNSPDSAVFHTGDTAAASYMDLSQESSTRTREHRLVEASVSDPDLKISLASPFSSLDRVVDALEDSTFPLVIKPSDLMEPSLRSCSMPPCLRSYSTASLATPHRERASSLEGVLTSTRRDKIVRTLSVGEDSGRLVHQHSSLHLANTIGHEASKSAATGDEKAANSLHISADAYTDVLTGLIGPPLPGSAKDFEQLTNGMDLSPGSEGDERDSRSTILNTTLEHAVSRTAPEKRTPHCIVQ
jgi:hypothetical protein